MNQLMITTMSKSQIKNIKINRKLDKKVNNAKFVSAQQENNTYNDMNSTTSSIVPWIKQPPLK